MGMGMVFFALSLALAWVAWDLQGAGYLLFWPAASFLLISMAYLGRRPGVFGKRPDGTLAPIRLLPLLPYLLLTWLTWHLSRRLRRAPAFNQLTDGVVIGRRLLPPELPAEVTVIADLTSEFAEPAGIRHGRTYLCLPTLDRSVPAETRVLDLLRQLIGQIRGPSAGVVYIHCAEGHGRTGTVAALLLAALGVDRTPDEALSRIVVVRPGVRLARGQRSFVDRVWPEALALRAGD